MRSSLSYWLKSTLCFLINVNRYYHIYFGWNKGTIKTFYTHFIVSKVSVKVAQASSYCQYINIYKLNWYVSVPWFIIKYWASLWDDIIHLNGRAFFKQMFYHYVSCMLLENKQGIVSHNNRAFKYSCTVPNSNIINDCIDDLHYESSATFNEHGTFGKGHS